MRKQSINLRSMHIHPHLLNTSSSASSHHLTLASDVTSSVPRPANSTQLNSAIIYINIIYILQSAQPTSLVGKYLSLQKQKPHCTDTEAAWWGGQLCWLMLKSCDIYFFIRLTYNSFFCSLYGTLPWVSAFGLSNNKWRWWIRFTGYPCLQRRACGSSRLAWSKGWRPLVAMPYSSREPSELLQWLRHNESIINIVLVIFYSSRATFLT